MAKKEKRISINALEKVYKENCPEIITEEWFGIEVAIKPVISVSEVLAFVDDVVDSSFLEDGTYVPEITPFFIRCNVLERYANFTLPEDLSKRYKLVYGTDAFGFVLNHIDPIQFEEIVNAIDARIDVMCDSDIIAMRAKFGEVATALADLGDQVNGLVGQLGSVLTDVNERTSSLVENLSPESIERIAVAFGAPRPENNKVIDLAEIKAATPVEEEPHDDQ